MLTASLAVVAGLALLIWSADRFVEGSAVTCRHFGVPPLVIGMVVIGFGTSAPEMMVSALSSVQGNPGIALGNAYGSNIANIALILGVTALISPIAVHSQVLHRELPLLTAVTILAIFQLLDGKLSRVDAIVLLIVFFALMAWTIRLGVRTQLDTFASEVEGDLGIPDMPLRRAVMLLIAGLILLILSSRVLVWGAVEIARNLGVSDLVIGLTIVAIGTSLPELASSVSAARKGEHEIALGNVLGSNLFNTLAVVGIAGSIHPMDVAREVLYRDMAVMTLLTLSLFVLCYGFGGLGRINRYEGAGLLSCFVGYTAYLVHTVVGG